MTISTDPYVKDTVELSPDVDYRVLVYREFPEIADLIAKRYGGVAPVSLFVEVYGRMKQPRQLDKMPVPIRQKSDLGIQSGIKEIYKSQYSTIKVADNEEVTGKVEAPNGSEYSCDIQVIKVLKALIVVSVTKNELVNRASASILPYILRPIMSGSYMTAKQLKVIVDDISENQKGYYDKQLLAGISEVLDG